VHGFLLGLRVERLFPSRKRLRLLFWQGLLHVPTISGRAGGVIRLRARASTIPRAKSVIAPPASYVIAPK
jgi:hypothetical protein